MASNKGDESGSHGILHTLFVDPQKVISAAISRHRSHNNNSHHSTFNHHYEERVQRDVTPSYRPNEGIGGDVEVQHDSEIGGYTKIDREAEIGNDHTAGPVKILEGNDYLAQDQLNLEKRRKTFHSSDIGGPLTSPHSSGIGHKS